MTWLLSRDGSRVYPTVSLPVYLYLYLYSLSLHTHTAHGHALQAILRLLYMHIPRIRLSMVLQWQSDVKRVLPTLFQQDWL